MRTTITIEKDVAARLETLRKSRPFKDVINEALRAGLDAMETRHAQPAGEYVLAPVEGRPRRTDLDNVAEVIAQLEGDGFR